MSDSNYWFTLKNRNNILHSIGNGELKRFENNLEFQVIECKKEHVSKVWEMINERIKYLFGQISKNFHKKTFSN